VFQLLGELDKSEAILRGVRPESAIGVSAFLSPVGYFSAGTNQARLSRRGYAETIELLKEGEAQFRARPVIGLRLIFLTFDLAEVERSAGQIADAKANYLQVRDALLAILKEQPGNAIASATLAQVYCALGERDVAISYANRAIKLRPPAKDAVDGPIEMSTLARIQARFGDRDHAIPALAHLLKTPSYLTPALLRLDPDFDKLRGDPRFEALAKQ